MRKILAISLALLVLAISLRVGVAFHYCGGNLAQFKIGIGHGKATCGMEDNKDSCQSHSAASFTNIPCCLNQLQQITTDVYHPAANFIKCLVEFNTAIAYIDYFTFEQRIEFNSFISYRPPPDLTSVSLPCIEVFRT